MCGPALEKDPCPLQVFLMDLITAETCDRASEDDSTCRNFSLNFRKSCIAMAIKSARHQKTQIDSDFLRAEWYPWRTIFTQPVVLHFCDKNSKLKVRTHYNGLKTAN